MNKSEFEMLEELDWLYRKMVRKFIKERDKITIEGVTLPGLLILKKIISDGEQRLTDLAEELDFTSGAITALSDKLEEKGLASRNRYKEDRRTVLLDITERGRIFMARHNNIGVNNISILFKGFSVEELQVQMKFYRHLTENLENFSTKIMDLAGENEKKTINQIDTNSLNKKSSYLNY